MYKLLLCWRYLRTRYIALASVISVMLGVATMIVVNSVMAGFTHEMQNRIHGILSDVVVESHSLEGFHDPAWHMQEIRRIAGKYISGMTPTVVVPAMLSFQVRGQWITRQVNFIGVEESSHSHVSDFSGYLQHPENRRRLSFDLRDGGYDTIDHQAKPGAHERVDMRQAGWPVRRWQAEQAKRFRALMNPPEEQRGEVAADDANPRGDEPKDQVEPQPRAEALVAEQQPGAAEQAVEAEQNLANDPAVAEQNPPPAARINPFDRNPFNRQQQPENIFDPAREQYTGIVLGISLASYRANDGEERFMVLPGCDVKLTLPTAGTPPKAVSDTFTVVDFYESKMSEYDSSFVFAPLRKVQQMRGMIDPQTDLGNVTSIQIKLHDDADGPLVRDLLQKSFPSELYVVQTWRDKQGPLLAAVQMETAILNVLLFMIIAVAGFGILAIFYMIVVEKTRDIGILKALGAHSRGVLGIFLGYGVSLGLVGSGVGMVIGLLFVTNINLIARGLAWVTGHEVFDPKIYYFQEIPTIIEPFTVAWIVSGAIVIAVTASILPAYRASGLHPVEALRYE